MTIKTVNLSPFVNQELLSLFAKAVSERLNVDKYYQIQAINSLLGAFDEKELEKEYPDYLKVKKKLVKMDILVTKAKSFYDLIEDKSFKKKYKDLDKYQRWVNTQWVNANSKIPLIQLDISKLKIFLVNHCSLQGHTIRADMLKVLEYRDNTRIDLSKRRKESTPVPGV